MRPTLVTGLAPAKVSTTAICRNTRKKSRMLSAPCSAKLSAQSPPCKRNPSPAATEASCFFSLRASPAKTSGGKVARRASVSLSAAMSGYAGTWLIGFALQEFGDHFVISAPNISGFCAGRPAAIAPATPETRLYTGTRPRILDRNAHEIECGLAQGHLLPKADLATRASRDFRRLR